MKKRLTKILSGVVCLTLTLTAFCGCFLTEEVDSENSLPPVESTVPDPVPDAPDAEKTVEREETDALGHKIVYYTDGTWEDLGRAVALNYFDDYTDKYGYTYFAEQEKGSDYCGFYADLYQAAKNFALSETNARKSGDYYEAATVKYSGYGLTEDEAVAVWKVFTYENPAFYWISNSVTFTSKKLTIIADEEYATYTARREIQTDIEELALQCDGYLNGKMSELERVLTIHDFVAEKIEYAYESDGVTPQDDAWAHNIVGATLGQGVCETYAKTFDYLCNLFDIPCVMLGGEGVQDGVSGGHAWNMFKLDCEWYLADVTWNDSETYLSREWLGMLATDFMATHIADTPENGYGVSYQFALPTFSKNELCPVLFMEEGGEESLLPSIDVAFENMQNEGGRYVITLFPDTKITAENGTEILPIGAAVYTSPSKAESITFAADIVYADKFHTKYYPCVLTAVNAFTLSCDITLVNVELSAEKLSENGFKITEKTVR